MNYDDFNKKVFGIRLKYYRILAELNQTELANILGAPQSMIAKYESGKTMPEPATIKRIAKALDTDVENFFNSRYLFNTKKNEFGTTYELTEIEPESREGDIYGFGSIDDLICNLSDEKKYLIGRFAFAIVKDENKEEFFKEDLEFHQMYLDEAKEALKDVKKLKEMQKIKAYMEDKNIESKVENPFRESFEQYLKEKGMTEAEYWEERHKDQENFVREKRKEELLRLREKEQALLEELKITKEDFLTEEEEKFDRLEEEMNSRK